MLSLKEIFTQALKNVRANLLRSVLTLLIIAVGITALVGILTAIDSFVYSLSDSLSSLGANSFSIFPKGQSLRGNRQGVRQKTGETISLDEAMSFKEKMNFNGRVCINVAGTGSATIKYGDEETNPTVAVTGIDDNYLNINALNISHGRDFSNIEQQSGSNLAIIGKDVVTKLFKGKAEKAVGANILIGSNHYKVLGVLESKGSSMNNSGDLKVFVPLLNIRKYYAGSNTNYDITAAVYNAADIEEATSQAIGIFRGVRRLAIADENDFEIFKSEGLVAIIKDNTTNIRLGTIVIGLMTLLGAAIGLMNIMLVSVTERTKEIGICKALGATQRSILLQFLTESVLICQLGGLVGIFLGVMIGLGVAKAMDGPFHMPWLWIFGGITACIIVGLVSGLYPAMKAAKLDPIESLRYE